MSEPLDPEVQEAWDFLSQLVDDYQRFVHNIGSLELAAPQTLYYRDSIQEILDALHEQGESQLFATAWEQIKPLDTKLRERKQALVQEIGYRNFLQYQIINDPPLKYWWWYLNRETSPPPEPKKPWEFWK